MTRTRLRNWLIGLDIFIAVGAVLGGIALLIQPDGSLAALRLGWLGGSPFDDYALPGVLLIVVIGLPFLVAGGATTVGLGWGPAASIVAGALLVAWIGVQLTLIGYHTTMQPLTAGFGVLTVLVAALLLRPPRVPRGDAHPA